MKEFTWDDLINASPAQRRKMWAQLRIDLPENAEWWENDEGCREDGVCPYVSDGWCKYMELPCGFNPFFTPRTGLLGMACMGFTPPRQTNLFESR